ncbi:thiamine phosphate synthase [Sulfurimonas sp.]|jgi:thiamine-phosphate pyrophosphorylase|uniref:thiamine phosphate synthase n=1 Tax=Sulfurimonas sp. TaxID=2022749 RepID=UPI002A36348A|nr:thiamine phosphate synthase [Sulfurimonas sp.]MDY0123717.1 thiamine phosphate synthase [Sulfurimonas sp.]
MRLYALCDQELLDKRAISLEEYIRIAKEQKAEIIQYRNKSADLQLIKRQLIKIRNMYEGFLIVNDAYELVEFCDGVHVGQEDLREIDPDPLKAIKILRGVTGKDKILGISTHSKEEVLQANEMDLNYIGLGAYRSTATKSDISAVLGESLDEIASHSKHFVAAIGGVKKSDKFSNVTYHVIGSGLLL